MPALHTDPIVLRTERLTLTSRDRVGLDLSLPSGSRLGILGSAGSGKTALLRVLAGLQRPVSGRMWWQADDVTRAPRWMRGRRRHFAAMLLSNPYTSLEPWLPVRRLFSKRTGAALAGELARDGIPVAAAQTSVRSWSGVGRVRLAAATALQHDPRVFLMDDVFGMVFPEVWAGLYNEMSRLAGESRVMIVASRFWQALVDVQDIVVLHRGKVVECGTRTEVFAHPQHAYTQWLLGGRVHHRLEDEAGDSAPPSAPESDFAVLRQIAPAHWVRDHEDYVTG